MEIKIGDRVRCDEITSIIIPGQYAKWYSNDVYTVKNIDKDVVELDKSLPKNSGNKINKHFLKLIKIERKKKLLKLNNL